ncbi:MAG TPA: NUDIX hydrolase [Candidatus Bathyarchaeia archaeon]|nr:NUDIX hydrolase [Candidatus Bathyarchaeia archaeon]
MTRHVGIIIKRGEKVLFIKRSKFKKKLPNIWAFPTGTVETGEKVTETAIREAKEELGVDIKVLRELSPISLYEFDDELDFVVCEIIGGEPKIREPREIDEIQWNSLAEFYDAYREDQIGHGLIYLKNHPEILNTIKRS